MARELAPVTACQPRRIYLTPRSTNVGAGLPAKTAWQPTGRLNQTACLSVIQVRVSAVRPLR
ncbi:hypothetical protein MF6394_24590 [Pseudomonas sp. MF6394]|nr:hypothetical protein MF6394_24590 [Pseudomonas sp. MF6394]